MTPRQKAFPVPHSDYASLQAVRSHSVYACSSIFKPKQAETGSLQQLFVPADWYELRVSVETAQPQFLIGDGAGNDTCVCQQEAPGGSQQSGNLAE